MPPPAPMTATAFLDWAQTQPRGRFELVDGQVVAMAPERNRHGLVKLDAAIALRQAIQDAGAPCVVFPDGCAVVINQTTVYEPDVTVHCGGPVNLDATTIDRPVVVVEVLSPGTQAIDTGAKLADYFTLPSLSHCLVLHPLRKSVAHYARQPDGSIAFRQIVDGPLLLDPPGLTLEVATLFASV